MSIQVGVRVVWGCEKRFLNAPITNLPTDTIKVRRRFRANHIAEAFVQTPKALARYKLAPDGDSLKLLYATAVNKTD
jgi:hypothetical protein